MVRLVVVTVDMVVVDSVVGVCVVGGTVVGIKSSLQSSPMYPSAHFSQCLPAVLLEQFRHWPVSGSQTRGDVLGSTFPLHSHSMQMLSEL